MKNIKLLLFLFLFSTFYFLPFVSYADINTGLVGYWNFDQSSGNITNDSSGSNNHGTLINGPVWTASGKIGGAISFDGIDDMIQINNSSIFDFGSSSFSYGLWVYKSDNVGSWDPPISRTGTGGTRYNLELGSANWKAYLHDGSVSKTSAISAQTINNQWVHIVTVVDRENSQLKTYKDGALITTTILADLGSIPTGSGLYIGGNGSSFFKGIVDEVRIYNKALGESEIAELFNYVNSAPLRSGGAPSGKLSIGTNSATLSLTTDKNSICRYSETSGINYESMTNDFSTSNVLYHTATISNLSDGNVYSYYVKCKDSYNNANDDDYEINFNVGRANYYISTSGDNNNNGSISKPWKTLNFSISKLQAGDTLYVRGGTYEESLLDNIPSGTSWDNAVTLVAYPGEIVTIKPTTSSSSGWVLHFQGQQYIVIDGFILDGSNVNYEVVKITYGGGLSAAHHIRIKNSELKNAPGQGILIGADGADFNEFINLNIHNNGTNGYHHGIYISNGDDNLIEKSLIYSNTGYGVHIYSADSNKNNRNIVRNNKIYNNGTCNCTGYGIILGGGNDNVAYNNVVWNNYYGGIRVAYGSPVSTKIYNNTVYNNKGSPYGAGISIGTDSSGTVVKNNVVYKNAADIKDEGANSATSTNLTTDPKFVDEVNYNFYLQPNSPAINIGETITAVSVDYSNTNRPQLGSYDIGAYEYIDQEAPTMPAGLSTAISTSQHNLSWATSTDNISISGYKIYRNGAEIATTQNTNYTDINLSPNTTYSYQVSAYDSSGNESAKSESITVTTQSSNTSSASNSGNSGGGSIPVSINPGVSVPNSGIATTSPATPETELAGRAGQATTITASSTYDVDEKAFFTKPIKLKSESKEVKKLQEFLSQDKEIYPEGLITGYYGLLTVKAVQRFQKKYGIVSAGSPETTGYGLVGPKTIAKLNEIYGKTKIQPSNPTPASSSGSSSSSSQNFSLRQLVELLIFTGVIAPDKADLARTSLKAIGM